MRTLAMMGVGLLCVSSIVAEESVEAPAPPVFPDLHTEGFEGGRRIDIHGVPLVGYAAPRLADGSRQLLLLTRASAPPAPAKAGPCDESRSTDTLLYRLEFDRAEPSLTLLRDDLPGDATSLDALDVDGDGVEEVLLFRPGQALMLSESDGRLAAIGPDVLFEDEELSRDFLNPALVRDRIPLDDPWLQVPGIGATRFYRPDPDSRTWSVAAEVEVGVNAYLGRAGFYVSSIPPAFLGRDSDGNLVFSGAIEAFGDERLKVSLIRPEKGEVEECWVRFPEPEIAIRRMAVLMNGEPVLLVTTRPADDFGLFDEQRLRVYPLERDRSRAGRPPLAAFRTRMNVINNVVPGFLDMDDDGRLDLVFGYWKGFDLDHVALDVYLQDKEGGFRISPRSSEWKLKKGDPSVLSFDRDLDGDGRFDLLLVAEEKLLIYRGLAPGKRWFEKRPAFTAPIGLAAQDPRGEVVTMVGPDSVVTTITGEPTRPQPLDLDGDGRSEVLFSRRGIEGTGTISLVLFDPASDQVSQ